MRIQINLICPYCEHTHTTHVEAHRQNQVFTCDPQGGGCDRVFVAKIQIWPDVTICKIEGEERLGSANDLEGGHRDTGR